MGIGFLLLSVHILFLQSKRKFEKNKSCTDDQKDQLSGFGVTLFSQTHHQTPQSRPTNARLYSAVLTAKDGQTLFLHIWSFRVSVAPLLEASQSPCPRLFLSRQALGFPHLFTEVLSSTTCRAFRELAL